MVWGTNENGNELRVNVDGAAHSTLHLIISVDILFTSLANPRHRLPPLRSCNTHSSHSFPLHLINLQGSLSSPLTTSPRNPLSTDFPSTHFMQHPLHLSLPHNTPRLFPPTSLSQPTRFASPQEFSVLPDHVYLFVLLFLPLLLSFCHHYFLV